MLTLNQIDNQASQYFFWEGGGGGGGWGGEVVRTLASHQCSGGLNREADYIIMWAGFVISLGTSVFLSSKRATISSNKGDVYKQVV